MSDILLSVGLQQGAAEVSQLQTDLQDIISQLDKNPPKVKVGLQVDQSALNHFKSQLTQIVNSVGLSNGAPITVNISGLGEIGDKAGQAKQALDGVAKAGESAAASVGKMTEKQTSDALTKINILMMQIQSNMKNWTAAKTGKSSASYQEYSNQLDILTQLKANVQANAFTASEFAERLSKIRAAATGAAQVIKSMGEDGVSSGLEMLTEDSIAQNDALTKTASLLAQVRKRQIEWTAAKNGKSSQAYEYLATSEQQLDKLIDKLVTGKMTADDFAKEFLTIKSNVNLAEGAIRSAGENTKTFGDRLKGLAEKFGVWLSISQAVMMAVRAIKQMVSVVIDIDTAMTELRKVTHETESTYNIFLNEAIIRANKLGASIRDVVNSSADFARLGLSLRDATTVSDAAIVYKNVGDGITDIAEATDSLISTMQAFGIEASDAMTIVDRFNTVGNKFAITSGGVGEAMLRSASAMHAAGNTIDETIALIAAANTVVQNPESVGTTLKTVSMYLRAANVEAEEFGESTDGMAHSVSELRAKLLKLTGDRVDILTDSGQYKSTYEILKEISKIWDDIVKNQGTDSAAILELLGGKRNANAVAAILENFYIAEDALIASATSFGSAMEENEKVMESIQGRITIFKNAFNKLSISLVNSSFVKRIVDLGTLLINILNVVGKIVNVLGGLRTVLIIISGIVITKKIDSIAKGLVKLWGNIKNIGSALKNLTTKVGAAVSAMTTLQIVSGSLSAIFAIVSMIQGAADEAVAKQKAQNDANISAAISAAEAVSSLRDLYSAYIDAADAVKYNTEVDGDLQIAAEELAGALGVEKEAVDSLSDSYEQLAKQRLQDAVYSAQVGVVAAEKNLVKTMTDWDTIFSADDSITEAYISALIKRQTNGKAFDDFDTETEQANALVNAYDALIDIRRQLIASNDTDSVRYDMNEKAIAMIEAEVQKLREATNALETAKSAYDTMLNPPIASASTNAYDIDSAMNGMVSSIEHAMSAYELLNKSINEMGSGGLTTDTIKSVYEGVSEKAENLSDYLYIENGAIKLNTDAWIEYARAQALSNIENINARIQALKDENLILKERKDDNAIAANNDEIAFLQEVLNVYNAKLEDIAKSTNQASDACVQYTKALSNIRGLSGGFDILGKIYSDVSNKGDFDWGELVDNEDFSSAFSDLGDAYDDFIKTVANSPDNISACQGAFDKLAAAYISNSTALAGVTDETRNATVAMLKQMGVANAASIVDERLAYNKELLRLQTILGEDATYADIYALYQQCEAGSVSAQILAQLAATKLLTNENGIKTAADIEQLEGMAKSANATTASLLRVAQAKQLMAQAEKYDSLADNWKPGAGFDSYLKYQEQAAAARAEAQKLLESPLEYDEIDFSKYKVEYSGSSATNSAKKSGAGSSKEETWFEKQRSLHQHLVAMNQETQEEYLAWLNSAYKQAYSEGIIDLNDYYKYTEEVYQGLQDLFRDYLGDVEHEISMRENYDGESKKIIELYEGLIEKVEKEIADARASGLTDEDDYIQELQQKWQDYTNSIKDLRDEITESAKDALDELVDYRIDMLKQEIENEKDALDERLGNLKEFYDKQKEMLQDQHDEENYRKEQADKRKSVTDLEAELAMLEHDDSAWAQMRKLELKEEIATAHDDVDEFEKEHALDLALDALDKAYNNQETQLQAEMDALEERLNDPEALYNKALDDIRKNSENQLYYQMLMYNRQYGDGNDETVKDLWESAFGALSDYENLFGERYQGVDLENETGVDGKGGWEDEKISGTSPDDQQPVTNPSGSTTTETPKSYPYGKASETSSNISKGATGTKVKAIQHALNELGFGNSGTADCDGVFGSGTQKAVKSFQSAMGLRADGIVGKDTRAEFKAQGYSVGTQSATPGIHQVDELGTEYVFESPSDGTRYRMFHGGEKVLTAEAAEATDFLYQFANSGGGILTQMISDLFRLSNFGGITKPVRAIEVNSGDIIVQGNASERTVSEIRRAQRSNLEYVLKELNRLNK